MKKPHEQEWKDIGGPCGGRIVNAADEVLADEVTEEALPLMLAAPDLARALLDVWSGTLFYRDGADVVVRIPLERWEAIGAALKKAGTVPYSP